MSKQSLPIEILNVTMELRDKFPEHYKLLAETPLFTSIDHEGVEINDFNEYLLSIQAQLKRLSDLK